jgi:hypothetical protein
MKYAILLLTLTIVAFGCTSVETSEPSDFIKLEMGQETADTAYVADVRLTDKGWDLSEAVVKKGSDLTVHVVTQNITCDYVTIDGERVAAKELENDEQFTIPFEESGTYTVTDETGQHDLRVRVIA